jgi:FkbM family methyltransferase
MITKERSLTLQPINFILSRALKLFSIRLPFFFPVVGRLKIILDNSIAFYMKSDGVDSIASRLYLYGPDSFEGESLNLLTRILKLDSVYTVLDIGANTGVYSLIAGATDKSLVIHAFEPLPSIHTKLVNNIETNSFSNVRAHKLALAEENGMLDFYFVPAITAPTGGSAAKAEWPETEKVIVEALKMDAFL